MQGVEIARGDEPAAATHAAPEAAAKPLETVALPAGVPASALFLGLTLARTPRPTAHDGPRRCPSR